jgi:hypothetical protein
MSKRHLSVPIEINATKTHCHECHFQHPEFHGCILFGSALRSDNETNANRRLEECVRAEWLHRKQCEKETEKLG